VKTWLKKNRNRLKTGQLLYLDKFKLAGHLRYYAITDNGPMCHNFRYEFTRMMFKWLNRRSQRRSYSSEKFNQALSGVGWPSVRILHDLCPFGVGPE